MKVCGLHHSGSQPFNSDLLHLCSAAIAHHTIPCHVVYTNLRMYNLSSRIPAYNFATKPDLFFPHYSLCFEAPIFPKIMLV